MSDLISRSEIWKDVRGYEGLYQVSNEGNVRSLDRIIKHYPKDYFQKGRILKTAPSKTGYQMVVLINHNHRETRFVHRLVAEAFLENANNYPVVNHKDENKANNQVENLEWCTHKHNANYGMRNNKISQKGKTKITKQSVMYEYKGTTKSLKQWADFYGMSYALFYSRWRKGKRGDELFKGYDRKGGVE